MKKSQKLPKKLKKKEKLALLISSSGPFIRVKDVEEVFELSKAQASKILSIWTKQGWLKRISQGIYAPVSFNENSDDYVLEEPWLLVSEFFSSDYYIGGLSASSYWGLTEQTFRSVFVFTTRAVRSKEMIIQNNKFIIKTIKKEKMFGKKKVWAGNKEIFISDIYKTLIDMLDDPTVGGGFQHAFHCFENFINDRSRSLRRSEYYYITGRANRRKFLRKEINLDKIEEKKIKTLFEYAIKIKNGAVLKRLGFFAEKAGAKNLADRCKKNLTKGYANLDTSIKCKRLESKWRLWVPENLKLRSE